MKPTILMRMILRKLFEEEYPGDEYPDEGAENEYDDAIYSPSDRKRKKRHPSEEEPEYETGKEVIHAPGKEVEFLLQLR